MSQISYGTITITDITDIDTIKNWYLATSASSGVTKSTSGWTDTIQQMTSTKQYLWNYEQILSANNTEISSTDPVIIGHYGQNGQSGADGNSITSIDEYYQATNSTTNPGASGWKKNTVVVPTSTNKYLWNYQVINYSKTAAEGTYADARIIGIYGDNGVSVTKTRELYYLKTNTFTVPTITATSQITATDRQNGWTSMVPTYVPTAEYWTCIETSLSSGGPVWSTPVKNVALTDESYRAWEALSISQDSNENAQGAMSQAAEAVYKTEALAAKVKHFWWDSDGAHAASGVNRANVTEGTVSTYGFNSLVGAAGITFGYNSYKAIEIDGSTPALKLYKPSKTTQGAQTAQLDANGLVLYEGGLEAGAKNTANYIYLYSKDEATNHSIAINNSGNKSDWRIIAGNKFGVDKTGKLYASEAIISGQITSSSGTIGGITINDSYGIYTNSKTSATSTNTGFLISKTGAIYLGAYDSTTGVASCPFQVDSNGSLVARSGRIGRFTLSNTQLTTGSGTSTAGMGSSTEAFWAGNATSSSAPFRVSYAGVLNATGATLTNLTIKDTTGIRVKVDTNGLTVYDGSGTADANIQARFGSTVQVGKKGVGYTIISSSGMDIYAGSSNTNLAHFGYDSGTNSTGGTSIAPYYTLGTRKSNSTIGNFSIAEGSSTTASGYISHAEGYSTEATGYYSHAEGVSTLAEGETSHAEGSGTWAKGDWSHAEGGSSHAKGECSHAGGYGCKAESNYSFAMGYKVTAYGPYQTAIGKYNVTDTSKAFIIGNGTSETALSNALTIDWNGNVKAKGRFYASSNSDSSGGSVVFDAGHTIDTNSTCLPQFSGKPSYLVGIEAFASGGMMKWQSIDGIRVGYANNLVLPGAITMYAGSTAPTGWLLCDGSAVSRTTYSELYAVIGTTYGSGNGSSTFNLPDLRGRAPIGAGTGSGLTARTLGTQNIGSENAIIPYHRHSVSAVSDGITGGSHNHDMRRTQSATATSGSNRYFASGSVESGFTTSSETHTHNLPAHNTNYAGTSGNTTGANMQPSAVVNFIICTGKTS